MKTTALLFVSAVLIATAPAAPKTRKGTGSTVPTKSPLIVIPAVPEVAGDTTGPQGLITTELGGRDVGFFAAAMESGLQLGYICQLLTTKGDAEQARAVGTALASTQSEENKQIARLGAMKGVRLSTEPPDRQLKLAADLEKLSGAEFDKTATEKVVALNRDAVTAYETAAQSKDPDIKAFADQMLPILQVKSRVTAKMTSAGPKAAVQLFRTGGPAKTPEATPAPKVPATTPAPPAK